MRGLREVDEELLAVTFGRKVTSMWPQAIAASAMIDFLTLERPKRGARHARRE